MPLQFQSDGIEVFCGVVSPDTVRRLEALPELSELKCPGGRAFEISPEIQTLITSDGQLGLLAEELPGDGTRPVRVLIFDKTPQTNWGVPWHQDRSLPVAERFEAPGFGPWTVKGSVPHAEMPAGAGDVVAMRGLTIHSSGHALRPSRRRVIHVDFCAADLPAELSWRAV